MRRAALPGVGQELERIDNVTDTALRAFRVRYNDNSITKDGIFDYVYGVLHAPGYRERFANDLAKNCRASRSHTISMPLRELGVSLRNFISAMRPARNIR